MIVALMTLWKKSTTSSFTQPPTLTCKAEFSVVLPKGFARYALPLFPTAILCGTLVLSRAVQDKLMNGGRVLIAALLVVSMIQGGILLTGSQDMSADSQYDDVADFLTSSSDEQVVIAEDWKALSWHLGEVYLEKYYWTGSFQIKNFRTKDRGSVQVIGVTNRSYSNLERKIESEHVDYVILSDGREKYRGADISSCGSRVQNWSAHYTYERRPHLVTVWQISECDG